MRQRYPEASTTTNRLNLRVILILNQLTAQEGKRLFFSSFFFLFSFSFFLAKAQAQIVPDATMPVNSIVTPQGPPATGGSFVIEGGTRAGGNLFHSFREFSVPTGGEAFFNNGLDVQNIFSRITGRSISNIDGLIRANGIANLFLLNPNGIIFGPHARLNIGGSFLASTANSIRFADGIEFSATNPQATPLLSINVPIGLQFGSNPGAIKVKGTGHNVQIEDPIKKPIERGNSTAGLEVKSSQTLALIGGDVFLEGGILRGSGGHIEIGSVTVGNVSLSASSQGGWIIGYEGLQSFGKVQLSQQSLVDASGDPGGSIQVQAKNLELLNASMMLVQNLGPQPAGNVRVQASESITLRGNDATGLLFSNIFNQVRGDGDGGDIEVSTGRLELRDGARIMTQTFGTGAGGNVTVKATESVDVIDFLPSKSTRTSVLGAYVIGEGQGGDLTVSTGQLRVLNGGTVAAVTFNKGNAGNVRIEATDSVEVAGEEPGDPTPSILGSLTLGTGNAGQTIVNTSKLAVRTGGSIGTSSYSTGEAGSLTINATESVEVSGTGPKKPMGEPDPSTINSAVILASLKFRQDFGLPDVPSGNAGKLTINTNALRVFDGGEVAVRNQGLGNAGTLSIKADSIGLDTRGAIRATTEMGQGGNIELNARSIQLNNGLIDTFVRGNGTAGGVEINASESVEVIGSGFDNLLAYQVAFINGDISLENLRGAILTGTVGSGGAGNIRISTGRLIVRDGGVVAVPALGGGAAGNLFVKASESVEVNGSFLSSPTKGSGAGGNIEVDTRRLVVRDRGQISSVTLDRGNAGELRIRAQDSVELIGSPLDTQEQPTGVSAPTFLKSSGKGGNISITTPQLIVRDRANVSANSLGTGQAGKIQIFVDNSIELSNQGSLSATTPAGGGSIELRAPTIVLRGGSITTNATGGESGGDINVQAQFLQLRGNSTITTNGIKEPTGGNINLTLKNGFLVLKNSDINAISQGSRGGDITIKATGIFRTQNSDITVIGGNPDLSGSLDIDSNVTPQVIQLPDNFQEVTLVASRCRSRESDRSEFIITGRGGLPLNPIEAIADEATWMDLRVSVAEQRSTGVSPVSSPENRSTGVSPVSARENRQLSTTTPEIVEAQGWLTNSDGQVELVAKVPTATPSIPTFRIQDCDEL